MKDIIAPVPKELLKAELTPDKLLRTTNRGENEIYVVTAHNAPNVMREVGRLREIAFRAAGGGTGKDVDIDEFDTMEKPYKQLVLWNPDEDDIIGGYRFIYGADIEYSEDGTPNIATAHGMFKFSEKFLKEYLPYTVELGRAFVALEYQSTRHGSKSLFALDNLWDGLGALARVLPGMKYYFGKVTMYPSYDVKARDMILHFLYTQFPDKDILVSPVEPLALQTEQAKLDTLFCKETIKDNLRILKQEVHALGVTIPPMVSAYIGLSATMKIFGTAINYGFGNVEETGLLIAADEIYDDKKKRYIESYNGGDKSF